MQAKKIIPCLDMREGRVVKGVNFVDIRDAGDPVEIAQRYNAEGADEIAFLDINATHEGRRTMLDVMRRVAEVVEVPFTVGGGIADVDWIDQLLKSGADKVSMGSAIVKRPELIDEAAARFGSARLVAAIDIRGRQGGGWDVITHGGRVNSGRDLLEWAYEVEKRGIGEILITSMDADGTKAGYDMDSLKAVTGAVRIPVTASGGAGTMEHFYEALTEGGAAAALAATLFHFREIEIMELKRYLASRGVPVRMAK